MRLLLGAFLFVLLMGVIAAQQSGSTPDSQKAFPGKFVDITSASGIQFNYLSSHTPKHYLPETMGVGVALFDYDNDGRLDIFLVIRLRRVPFPRRPVETVVVIIAHGHAHPVTAYGGNKLYHNNGNGTFTDVTEKAGVAGSGWSTSAARVDLDNDGETPTRNHWLPLKLVGHKSNRDAIGAEVKLVTAKGQQFVTVSTAGSYLSSSDKRVHFGLGAESLAQSIEIRWPSGLQQTLKNVRADQILQVDEPASAATQK